MSYNISNWKTKRLEGLTIPLKAFYKHARKDWHPASVVKNPETNEIELDCGCEQSIKGVLKDGILTVTAFDMSGKVPAPFTTGYWSQR